MLGAFFHNGQAVLIISLYPARPGPRGGSPRLSGAGLVLVKFLVPFSSLSGLRNGFQNRRKMRPKTDQDMDLEHRFAAILYSFLKLFWDLSGFFFRFETDLNKLISYCNFQHLVVLRLPRQAPRRHPKAISFLTPLFVF